jgi:hypothetical protein
MISPDQVRDLEFSGLQIVMAILFFDLARRRPQVEIEAKIYAACALAFAAARMPEVFGTSNDFTLKFAVTMAEWTNLAFISIVVLDLVSREALAFNGFGAALGIVAIVAVLDPYVAQLCNLFDFTAVSTLGLSIVAADRGRNPKATHCLTAATALYATVQLDWPGYQDAHWFKALISSSSLAFSLALLVVMYGRTNSIAYKSQVAAS